VAIVELGGVACYPAVQTQHSEPFTIVFPLHNTINTNTHAFFRELAASKRPAFSYVIYPSLESDLARSSVVYGAADTRVRIDAATGECGGVFMDEWTMGERLISFSCGLRFRKHMRTSRGPTTHAESQTRRTAWYKNKKCREWAAEKRNPTSEAH
jgi:hypothetical protein